MGSVAKKSLEQYMLQLREHPLRTKVITAGVLSAISDIVSQKLSGIQKLQVKRILLKVALLPLKTQHRQVGSDVYEGQLRNKSDHDELKRKLVNVQVKYEILKNCAATLGAKAAELEVAILQAVKDIVTSQFHIVDQEMSLTYRVVQLFGAAYLGPLGHYFHLFLDKLFKGKKDTKTVGKKVVLEQVTVSPLNNLLFMIYYGLVIEGRPWTQVKSKVKKEYPTVQYTAWTFWPVVGWINHQYVPLQLRVIFQSFVAFGWGIFLNLRARSLALTKG